MHIDLFVLFAQIFNFLVLVFLLKYLLYNRIIGAMDAREARIASQFAEAERMRSEAQQTAREFDTKNRELQEMSEEMMVRAQKASEQEKEKLMDTVRSEVGQVKKRWYETLTREKKAFLEELRRRAGTYIYDTIRQVLSEMADNELEDRMVRVFVMRAQAMDQEQQDRLREALKTGPAAVMIRSAFTLNPDQRRQIEDAVRPYVGEKVSIRYEVQDTQTAGIEMMAHGYKLSWSIADYLSSLEEKFVATLKEEIHLDEQAV